MWNIFLLVHHRNNTNGARTKNVKVFLANSLPTDLTRYMNSSEGQEFATFEGPGAAGEVITLTGTGEGKFVVIQMRTDAINLLEVKVLGNPGETKNHSFSMQLCI